MATEIKLECPMGHKKTMRYEEADGEQPMCEQCFMPLIVQEVVNADKIMIVKGGGSGARQTDRPKETPNDT